MLDDDDIERQLSLELDLVKRRKIRRVGNGDSEPVAALAQCQHALCGDELLVDDVARQLLEVDRRQIQHRVAECLGRELGDAARGQPRHIRGIDQLVDELGICLCGLARKVLGPVGAQLSLLDECTRETGEGPCGGARTLRYGRHGMVLSLGDPMGPKL